MWGKKREIALKLTICSEKESVPESLIFPSVIFCSEFSSIGVALGVILSDLYPSLNADMFILWSTSISLPISDRASDRGVVASASLKKEVKKRGMPGVQKITELNDWARMFHYWENVWKVQKVDTFLTVESDFGSVLIIWLYYFDWNVLTQHHY